MRELHKGSHSIGNNVETKEEERGPLCSNKADARSSSLDFIPNAPQISRKIELDTLANILVDIFLEHKRNESKK